MKSLMIAAAAMLAACGSGQAKSTAAAGAAPAETRPPNGKGQTLYAAYQARTTRQIRASAQRACCSVWRFTGRPCA